MTVISMKQLEREQEGEEGQVLMGEEEEEEEGFGPQERRRRSQRGRAGRGPGQSRKSSKLLEDDALGKERSRRRKSSSKSSDASLVSRGSSRFVVVSHGPAACLQVRMQKGDSIKAEADALLTMSSRVQLSSDMEGGFFASLLRSAMTSESLFYQKFKAKSDGQDVLLAAADVGDIVVLDITPHTPFKLVRGAFLASDESVEIEAETQWDMRKAAFGQGLFVMHASGTGSLAINSFGSMLRYELEEGERRVVDNGHVVAWTADTEYVVRMASKSLYTSVTSGEGMVCEFQGPGEIYIQTHKQQPCRQKHK